MPSWRARSAVKINSYRSVKLGCWLRVANLSGFELVSRLQGGPRSSTWVQGVVASFSFIFRFYLSAPGRVCLCFKRGRDPWSLFGSCSTEPLTLRLNML